MLLVAVDAESWPPLLTQRVGEVVGDALRVDEDQDFAILLGNGLDVRDEAASREGQEVRRGQRRVIGK